MKWEFPGTIRTSNFVLQIRLGDKNWTWEFCLHVRSNSHNLYQRKYLLFCKENFLNFGMREPMFCKPELYCESFWFKILKEISFFTLPVRRNYCEYFQL